MTDEPTKADKTVTQFRAQDLAQFEGLAIGLKQRGEKSAAALCDRILTSLSAPQMAAPDAHRLEAMANVLRHSVITFGGVEQSKLGAEASDAILAFLKPDVLR